jgi:hypothetical protein
MKLKKNIISYIISDKINNNQNNRDQIKNKKIER